MLADQACGLASAGQGGLQIGEAVAGPCEAAISGDSGEHKSLGIMATVAFPDFDGHFEGKTTHDDTREDTLWQAVQLRTSATSPLAGNVNGRGHSRWRGEEAIPFLVFGTYDLKTKTARVVKVHLGDHNNHVLYEFSLASDGTIAMKGAFSRGSLRRVSVSPKVEKSERSSSSSASASA